MEMKLNLSNVKNSISKSKFAYLNYNIARALPYFIEYQVLNKFSRILGEDIRDEGKHERLKKMMLKEIFQTLNEQANDYQARGKSLDSFKVKDYLAHVKSFLSIVKDYPRSHELRKNNITKPSTDNPYPEYFNRNFHFQVDGYTSDDSAKKYDHQVEILFAGLARPMRELILKPLYNLRNDANRILEIACGTGAATEIMSEEMVRSDITATDLSEEYINYAKNNRSLKNVSYHVADAENLKLESDHYDIVYHVFLCHELPSKVRVKALKEQLRVVRPGGKCIIVDSLQLGDRPLIDEVLVDFPKYYHEPFYTSYIKSPLEKTLKEIGAKQIKTEFRFLSKLVTFTK